MSQQTQDTSVVAQDGFYLARHWRGDISLGKSYWLNGVLIAFLSRVVWVAGVAGLSVGMKDRATLVAGLYAMIAIFLCLYVWQVVGVWRSATKHVGRGGKRVWAVLAQIACVIGVIAAAITLFQNMTVTYQIATDSRYWLDPASRR